MYTHKTYRDGDANRLLSYLGRTDRPIRGRDGREMSSDEIQQFLDTSETHKYEESWIYSPKNGDELSPEEISLAVRKTMRRHLEDRDRATYCYSIHTDQENTHAHIAATGDKDALRTDTDDLDRMRELGAEHTREHDRDRRRRERDHRRARENARGREQDRTRSGRGR